MAVVVKPETIKGKRVFTIKTVAKTHVVGDPDPRFAELEKVYVTSIIKKDDSALTMLVASIMQECGGGF